ncbi:MAG: hypothetical protein ACD_46C00291G0001 [uncultured bacterium]|nr:MAG: hypothetical protein ACD_46C00291G0001 [uncultured bacterium]
MKKSTLLMSALLFSISNLTFASAITSLNKAQVTNILKGNTITTISLATLNGTLINNSFTGYFDKSGQIHGSFATKPYSDQQGDRGKWVVKSDGTLCATWDHWHQSKPICVSVYKLENGMVFVNKENKKLETIILDENIKSGNQLSSS